MPRRQDHAVWNEELARQLVGATMLVGIAYAEHDGDRHEQFFGEVLSADSRDGVILRLAGKRSGETFRLPPDLRGVSQGTPQSYRLRSTGEIVESPDFVATWIVHAKSARQ
jgi:hypothetical protein